MRRDNVEFPRSQGADCNATAGPAAAPPSPTPEFEFAAPASRASCAREFVAASVAEKLVVLFVLRERRTAINALHGGLRRRFIAMSVPKTQKAAANRGCYK